MEMPVSRGCSGVAACHATLSVHHKQQAHCQGNANANSNTGNWWRGIHTLTRLLRALRLNGPPAQELAGAGK